MCNYRVTSLLAGCVLVSALLWAATASADFRFSEQTIDVFVPDSKTTVQLPLHNYRWEIAEMDKTSSEGVYVHFFRNKKPSIAIVATLVASPAQNAIGCTDTESCHEYDRTLLDALGKSYQEVFKKRPPK